MAAFRLPVVSSLRVQPAALHVLPSFEFCDIHNKELLGKGSYGLVYKANHKTAGGNQNVEVVVKRMLSESSEDVVCFAKEAKLLCSISHKNVVSFLGYCPEPCAIMLEYVFFDFKPFGVDKKVNSLLDLLNYLDRINNVNMLGRELQAKICMDIGKGLEYLHSKDTVHRDLKTANVLVSNRHYCHLTNVTDMTEACKAEPIICKLADFGESRSRQVQTAALHSTTVRVDRGTMVYMAPEIVLEGHLRLKSASFSDFKKIDMWAFGMVLFSILNPDQRHPFQKDLADVANPFQRHRELLALKRRPSRSIKYEEFQATDWLRAEKVFLLCTEANPSLRPSASEAISLLGEDNLISERVPLNVSQASALEMEDQKMAIQLENKSGGISCEIPDNDGSNACVFLCLRICHELWNLVHVQQRSLSTILKRIPAIAESVIWNLPFKINKLRNTDNIYTVQEAYKVLLDADEIGKYQFSATEDVLHKVFSLQGRSSLSSAVTKIAGNGYLSTALFCCEPYIFIIGAVDGKLFILDTHPMHIQHSGLQGGVLEIFPDQSKASVDALCAWVWQRVRGFGISGLQGILLMTPIANFSPAVTKRPCQSEESIVPRAAKHFKPAVIDLTKESNDPSDGISQGKTIFSPKSSSSSKDGVDDFRKQSSCSQNNYRDKEKRRDGDEDKSKESGTEKVVAVHSSFTKDHSTNTAEKFWNGDSTKPILESGKADRYVTREAVSLLLDSTNPRCESVPLRVRQNASFLVESERYSNNRDDVKCDMNGVYPYVLRIGVWTIETDRINGFRDVDVLCKKKGNLKHPNQYHLHINSKKNAFGLCRSIFYLTDSVNQIVNDVILLQYHHNVLGKEEVEFQVPSHGNRKNSSLPFYPSQKSTLNEMKKGLSSATPSTVYNRCISDNGGALKATNPGQLPRSRQQLYQMKYEKVRREDGEELLVYAKNKEETIIIEHHDMPEDLWVLGTKQMCEDMTRFCTSPVSSYPFSVDPTFNFGKYEVTPFTYRHLLLKSQRTGVPPVFLGPTALHHSKERKTYLKVVTAVAANCPNLANNARGYVTDGEEALYSALGEVMKSATALRCFNHFQQNCKAKLKKIGLTKPQEQSVFLKAVFGKKNEDKEEAGILDAEDAADLHARLLSCKDNLEREERRLLGKDASYQPLFWAYLKNNERMMRECMIADARQKAGMPLDEDGMPMRSYTNQSECINNVLTKQKEAAMKNDKAKSNMSKLAFVRSVWEEVLRQQKEEVIMALCGLSRVYDLADMAQYLRVDPDIWFSWSEKERTEYLERFNQLTVEEVMAGKTIRVAITYEEEPREWREFSLDIVTHLAQLPAVSIALASAISDEATKLLNMDEAISKRPTLDANEPQKYLVAAKGYNKKGLYECIAHKDHISCGCPSYKYSGVCKHSLCVAEKLNMLKGHLQYTAQKAGKGKATKSLLLEPANEGAGKKGGKRRNHWRVSRQAESATCTSSDVDSPFTKIHHNNRPLVLSFLQDRPKAVDCKQCGFEFPRRPIIVPLDIVLEHEERWMYPDPQNKGKQLPSGKHTTKYYCVKRSCILDRFPYFNTTDFLTLNNDVRSRLKESHWKVLEQELGFHK